MDEKSYLDFMSQYTVNGKVRKIPLDVLTNIYEEIEATMIDLKDLARLLHVCEIMYEHYKNEIPLPMRLNVASYLLSLKDKRNTKGDDMYFEYYNETVETVLYEINLANYLKGEPKEDDIQSGIQ
jgi:hypothetical protein